MSPKSDQKKQQPQPKPIVFPWMRAGAELMRAARLKAMEALLMALMKVLLMPLLAL